MGYYQSFPGGVQALDSAATRGVPLEKKVDRKYMHLNVLRNIASMTKRGDDIPTY